MRKFFFILLTIILVTIVASILSAMKPGDKIPDVSSAILLVGAIYLVLFILNKFLKSFKSKREDAEIEKIASELFTEGQTNIKKNFLKKIRLKKINVKLVLIAFGLFFVAFFFYWYQVRPSEIRKSCANGAIGGRKITNSNISGINNRYRECLVNQGFKPESLFVK